MLLVSLLDDESGVDEDENIDPPWYLVFDPNQNDELDGAWTSHSVNDEAHHTFEWTQGRIASAHTDYL